jgi:homoserine O-acetyltransferase/O-succinyltransferase
MLGIIGARTGKGMTGGVFEAGDVRLEGGAVLPGTRLAYRTYGQLSRSRDNVVLNPTWYAGVGNQNEWLFGPGRALDTNQYFVVVPEMLGNGVSSSPSNHPSLRSWAEFPPITIRDNVRLQSRLLDEVFGVRRLKLAIGWSMGAQQVFEWGTLFPQQVETIVAMCGTARTTRHNWVFLEGVKAALTGGTGTPIPRTEHGTRRAALRTVGRVYAGWALSQAFYRQQRWRDLNFDSLEEFLAGFWEGLFADKDVDDLVVMLLTWQAADVSSNPAYGGDIKKALAAIRARTVVMPSTTDLYFTVEDSAAEAALIQGAELRCIASVFGHAAGVGLNAADTAFIEQAIAEVLR